MEKNEATLILAKALAKRDYINLIVNNVDQAYIKDNNLGFEIIKDRKYSQFRLDSESQDNLIAWVKTQEAEELKKIGANYLFGEIQQGYSANKWGLMQEKFIYAVPHAIITQTEVPILQNLFYKDVDYKIKCAMSELNIKDYIDEYEIYKKNDINEYLRAGKERYVFSKFSDSDWNGYSDEFEFIFGLPKEQQNTEFNIELLDILNKKKYGGKEVTYSEFYFNKFIQDMMYDSYAKKDPDFIDYFDILNNEAKGWIIDIVKSIDGEKIDDKINSALYKRGNDVPVKLISLYKEDKDALATYLSNLGDADKEEAVLTIMKIPEDERNLDSERYVSDNYQEIIQSATRKSIQEQENGK